MIGLVGFLIRKVREGEFRATDQVIVDAGQPQGFKIRQVTGLLLRGPLFVGSGCEGILRRLRTSSSNLAGVPRNRAQIFGNI